MSRPVLIYYLLAFYVFASFAWWTYLLLDSNSEIIQIRRELMELKNNNELQYRKSKNDFYKSDNYVELFSKYKRRIWMIAGEGSVFIILLSLGIWKIKQSINKEISLANQQKNFMLSITHELKSPLAAIKLSLETLKLRNLPKEKSDQFTDNALSDVERLRKLVDNILLAASIENHSYSFSHDRFDFSSFITETVSKIRETTPLDDRTLHAEIGKEIMITGDRISLASVINNLVENAIKYSENKSRIYLSLNKTEGEIILELKDEGIGIHGEEKEKVFERFYRSGNEETRKTSGTGLGLFIVREIIHAHHGKISIRDNFPKGTIFIITFPVVSIIQ